MKVLESPWLYLSLLVVLLLSSGCYGYFQYKSMKDKLVSSALLLEKERKEHRISSNTLLSSLKVVHRSKMNKLNKELAKQDKDIKKLLKKLKEKKREVVIRNRTRVQVLTHVIYKDKKSDLIKQGVYKKTIVSKKGLVLASTSFNTKKLTKPWSYETYPLTLRLQIFQSVKRNTPDMIGLSAKLRDFKGREVKARILSSATTYSYPKTEVPKWVLSISPFRLELYAVMGLEVAGPSFSGGFGLSSHLLKLNYGSKDVFRFLGLGIGYNSPGGIHALLFPVSYNLGSVLPIISDLFLTLGVGVGIDLTNPVPAVDYLVMFGISTTL